MKSSTQTSVKTQLTIENTWISVWLVKQHACNKIAVYQTLVFSVLHTPQTPGPYCQLMWGLWMFSTRSVWDSCLESDGTTESEMMNTTTDRSDFTVASPIPSTHLGIWTCGSTWRSRTVKHGSSAAHQRITQPTSWPYVASPTWSSTEQVARPATKLFHTSDWRPLKTCCRPWTWWCNDATAFAGYANMMIWDRRSGSSLLWARSEKHYLPHWSKIEKYKEKITKNKPIENCWEIVCGQLVSFQTER